MIVEGFIFRPPLAWHPVLVCYSARHLNNGLLTCLIPILPVKTYPVFQYFSQNGCLLVFYYLKTVLVHYLDTKIDGFGMFGLKIPTACRMNEMFILFSHSTIINENILNCNVSMCDFNVHDNLYGYEDA